MQKNISVGGFCFPIVYEQNQSKVGEMLANGDIDYADFTKWNFPDEFMSFVMDGNLLQFMDKTYPNPRVKNEIPIWFLITCQFVMRLHQSSHYNDLRYLLNSGSILSRFGFNVGANIGFNDKNKKPRKTAVDADSVRKFFKDTKAEEIRDWYGQDLQNWFRTQKAYDHHGIFILDQTHLVVPDNPNYKDAVKMPVNEHGQWYSNLSALTSEQKKALTYHRCYTLSTLLNVGVEQEHFHIADYEFGPGNEDELVQAERMLPDFCRKFPGVIKTLIFDRGYIDSNFIHKMKHEYNVDVLIPLRKNMDAYVDAVSIAKMQNHWETIETQTSENKKLLVKKEIATVHEILLWQPLKIYALVTKYTVWNAKLDKYDENYSVLISTKKYSDPKMMVSHYELRVKTEERFRQLKHSWYIVDFPSPHASLIESHICFTLFTYSLLQLYLRRNDLQKQTRQMMKSLQSDEQTGVCSVVVYAGEYYAVFDLDDYTIRITKMDGEPKQRLASIMQAQKEERLRRKQ